MQHTNISFLVKSSLEQNQPEVKIVWFDISRNGAITYIDLAQLTQATRRQRLEALANSGTLGAFIHKSDSVFATMHHQHAENFRRVNSGLKIEGKKVEVIELSDADYLQFMSAAIAEDAGVKKDENDKEEANGTKHKPMHSVYNPQFYFNVCFHVQKTFHKCVMSILDNMQKNQQEMDELRKESEKRKEELRQFDNDTMKIVARKKAEQKEAIEKKALLA